MTPVKTDKTKKRAYVKPEVRSESTMERQVLGTCTPNNACNPPCTVLG